MQADGKGAHRRNALWRMASLWAGAAILFVVVVAVAVLLPTSACGCATPASLTPPPAALTESQAIEAALRVVPASAGSAPRVAATTLLPNPFEATGKYVWIVRFDAGVAAEPCPPSDKGKLRPATAAPCLDAAGGVTAVLDATTGELIGWSS